MRYILVSVFLGLIPTLVFKNYGEFIVDSYTITITAYITGILRIMDPIILKGIFEIFYKIINIIMCKGSNLTPQ